MPEYAYDDDRVVVAAEYDPGDREMGDPGGWYELTISYALPDDRWLVVTVDAYPAITSGPIADSAMWMRAPVEQVNLIGRTVEGKWVEPVMLYTAAHGSGFGDLRLGDFPRAAEYVGRFWSDLRAGEETAMEARAEERW